MRFYATVEIWTSISGQIKRTVNKRERSIGVHVQLKIKKNRITGKTRTVEVDIYPSYGIDDIGTCVDYLVEEDWWRKKKQSIDAQELGVILPRDNLVQKIEENGWENEVRALVGKCWGEIEAASTPDRKAKY